MAYARRRRLWRSRAEIIIIILLLLLRVNTRQQCDRPFFSAAPFTSRRNLQRLVHYKIGTLT